MDSKSPKGIIFLFIALVVACSINHGDASNCKKRKTCKKNFTFQNLSNRLSALSLAVTQFGAREAAGSGRYINYKKKGNYGCGVCEKPLFSSDRKLTATDYATFRNALSGAIDITTRNIGAEKEEDVSCGDCGSEVGVKTKDGKIKANSAALKFVEAGAKKKAKLMGALKKLRRKSRA